MLLMLVAVIATMFGATNANAQERVKMGQGIYLVSYGNTFVIENDNTQQTISLSVNKKTNNAGEEVYQVLCGNSYTKTVAKYALTSAISGAVAASGVGSWAAGLAGALTSKIYEDVCSYYSR